MAGIWGLDRTRASQNGFALVGILIALPVMLTIATGLALLGFGLKNHTTVSATCRFEVWAAQREMGELLKELLRLNPLAKRLKRERTQAEAELKAARLSFNPKLIAAAEAHRAWVVAQQTRLRQTQEQILSDAQRVRAFHQKKFLHKTMASGTQILKVLSPSPTLAVQRFSPQDLAPEHQPLDGFVEFQRLEWRWQSQLFYDLPAWLKEFSPLENPNFTGACAASLTTKEKKWHPRLLAARSSPS